jgi:gas vesicle protein
MFNPKENLLDQQLAVSGLEMNITWAGVGAIASIAGGIFGASSASKQNREAKKAQQRQQEIANKQAEITNAYNRESFEAEKKDYFAARQFQYETAVKQWKYDTAIQDLRYVQDVRAYEASVENYGQQTMFNNVAYQAAKESNQASYNEALAANAFEGETMLVENLEAAGRAALGQAGVSRGKAMQALAAKQGRDLAVLRASMSSQTQEFRRGMYDLALQKYGADMQAKASLMMKPDRLPELIAPEMGPARTFVEPAEVLPGAVPPAQRVNPLMPLIGGISGAAGMLAGPDRRFSGPAPQRSNAPQVRNGT